jgi:DNA-binding NarL/FixJ family response regulator
MLAGDGVEVAGEAGGGETALRSAVELGPDVVLLDLELPDADGLAVRRRLKDAAPATPVLVVTMHDDTPRVRRAVEAGAAGYVLKGIGRRELRAAVRAVHDGESVIDPPLLRALLASTGDRAPGGPGPGRDEQTAPTPVEIDLLRLIAEGLTNREIAERLRWSQGTVKKYVQRVLEKLGVSDRTQAAVEAVRRRLLE